MAEWWKNIVGLPLDFKISGKKAAVQKNHVTVWAAALPRCRCSCDGAAALLPGKCHSHIMSISRDTE